MTVPIEWATYLAAAVLVLVRVGGMVVASPVFSSRSIPPQIKVGLAVTLVMVIFPPGAKPPATVPHDLLPFAGSVLSEAIVGLAVGFATSLVFAAIQTGASLIGMQVGFSLATLVDPMFEGSSAVIDTFYSMFAVTVFLTLSGHHWLIQGVQHTFDVAPLGASITATTAAEQIITMTSQLWVIALQISLPVTAALLLTDVALGILARTVPQLNIFVISMPVKVLVGLTLIFVTLPALFGFLDSSFRSMTAQAQLVVK